MKKKFPVRNKIRIGFLILLIFVIAVFEGYSQKNDQNMLDVYGELISDLGTLNNAEIKIKEDDFDWLNVKLYKHNGRFNLALPVGHTFLFNFIQEGTIAKQILFSTKTPEEYENVQYAPFIFIVRLESYMNTPEIDTLFYKKPVGKIFFSEEFIKFDYDRDYDLYVKKRIAQVKEEVQLKQQLLAQAEQRKTDSIAGINMLAQTKALKDTFISDEIVMVDTLAVAEVTELPDSAESVLDEPVSESVTVDEDTVLLASVETEEIPEKIDIKVEEPKSELNLEETNRNTPEKAEVKAEEGFAEIYVVDQKEPITPIRSNVDKKPDPVPVAMGKPNGNEYEFQEYENVQVTKIYVTRSKKTIIYSMYQYKNGNTRYYKQQPFTNDSIQINRDIFTKSLR